MLKWLWRGGSCSWKHCHLSMGVSIFSTVDSFCSGICVDKIDDCGSCRRSEYPLLRADALLRNLSCACCWVKLYSRCNLLLPRSACFTDFLRNKLSLPESLSLSILFLALSKLMPLPLDLVADDCRDGATRMERTSKIKKNKLGRWGLTYDSSILYLCNTAEENLCATAEQLRLRRYSSEVPSTSVYYLCTQLGR